MYECFVQVTCKRRVELQPRRRLGLADPRTSDAFPPRPKLQMAVLIDCAALRGDGKNEGIGGLVVVQQGALMAPEAHALLRAELHALQSSRDLTQVNDNRAQPSYEL